VRNLAKNCCIKNCKNPAYSKNLCKSHYSKEWVKKNPEKDHAIRRRYYERNRLEILKRVAKYQEKNYEKIQKRHREYYLENRSRILKLKKERDRNSKKN